MIRVYLSATEEEANERRAILCYENREDLLMFADGKQQMLQLMLKMQAKDYRGVVDLFNRHSNIVVIRDDCPLMRDDDNTQELIEIELDIPNQLAELQEELAADIPAPDQFDSPPDPDAQPTELPAEPNSLTAPIIEEPEQL